MNRQYTEKEILELKEKIQSLYGQPLEGSFFGDAVLSLNDGDFLTQLVDGLEHPEKYC